jgi:hypothetical protein
VTAPAAVEVIPPDDPRAVAVAARLRPESYAAVRDPFDFALAFDPADFDLNPGFDWP